MQKNFKDIPVPSAQGPLTLDQAQFGHRLPPQQQLILYSPGQWEDFAHEWVHYGLKQLYLKVERFSGPGDEGIDVAAYTDAKKLDGIWDNYQCKHYDHALQPSDVWAEFGKILWYSCMGSYKAPRQYFFVAPRGAGTKLTALLGNAAKLKAAVLENWDKHIRKKITDTQEVALEGKLLDYVEGFDFSIFEAKTSLEIIELHREKCPYHVARFGGGLPERPEAQLPPDQIAATESRYVSNLLDAYADHTKQQMPTPDALKGWPKLSAHFIRQREAFYYAEGLRVFARDSVPAGTFESLQEEIYDGIIDVNEADHSDGLTRLTEVMKTARSLELTSNALLMRAKMKDRDGICHQLSNDEWLKWTK